LFEEESTSVPTVECVLPFFFGEKGRMTKETRTKDIALCWAPSRRDYLANALSEITSMNCQAGREGKRDLLIKKGGVKGTPDDIGFGKSPKMRQASVQRKEAAFQNLKQTRVKPSCKERQCNMRQTAIEDFFQRKIPIPCLFPTNRFIAQNLQRDKQHAVRSELGYFHAIARCSLEGMHELKMAMQPRVTLEHKREGPEGDEMGKHFEVSYDNIYYIISSFHFFSWWCRSPCVHLPND